MLATDGTAPLEQVVQSIVELVPRTWRYPEGASARIVINGAEFHTADFPDGDCTLQSPIVVAGSRVGTLELRYARRHTAGDEPAFIDEEQHLIATIAERLGKIIQRKRAEDAAKQLQGADERFRLLSEASPIGIFQTDLQGKSTYINKRWSEITGVPPEDGLGDRWIRSVHPDDREMMRELWSRAVGTERGILQDFRMQTPGGKLRWAHVRTRPVRSEDGTLVGYAGTLEDITEQKLVEAQLRDARVAAEAANHAKSAFLANMTHEIRTPLNVIIGMTDMTLDGELAAEQRDYLGRVRAAAIGLLTIVNDVLDEAKIEAGKMTIEVLEMDLGRTLDEALALFTPTAQAKGLALISVVPPALPLLKGDPIRIRQIVVNLVGNAIKFTDTGSITVDVRLVKRTPAHAVVRVSVTDTGVGIPPEHQAAIFDSFVQGDDSTARVHGGTGLGLAICRQLVTLMGGRMSLESVLGKGSTFWFEITLALASAPAADAA
jgi:PAS domain S-box-containing protein